MLGEVSKWWAIVGRQTLTMHVSRFAMKAPALTISIIRRCRATPVTVRIASKAPCLLSMVRQAASAS
jgi:hypothetical protein